MKKSLKTVIEKKIEKMEKTAAAELDSLMEESSQHTKDVDAVVAIVISAVYDWRKTQLQEKELQVQKAITEQTNVGQLFKSSWENKLKTSNFQKLVDARKAIKKDWSRVKNFDVDISLGPDVIDPLRDSLDSLCDKIQTSIRDGVLPRTLRNTAVKQKVLAGLDNLDCPVSFIRSGPHVKKGGGVVKQSTASQTEEEVSESNIDPPLTESTSICPKCNEDIPLFLEKRANLYNLQRNSKFLRAVHDRRRGENLLICQTDDFIFTVELNLSKDDVADNVGELRSQASAANLYWLRNWYNVLHSSFYADDLAYCEKRWKEVLLEIRTGIITFD
jgi:hypothetical protein